jgi:uncharacterized protein
VCFEPVLIPARSTGAPALNRLVPLGVRVGTVDKFQGQDSPVVIYSMATSRPEDAPRGMEFLYTLVATSRSPCRPF